MSCSSADGIVLADPYPRGWCIPWLPALRRVLRGQTHSNDSAIESIDLHLLPLKPLVRFHELHTQSLQGSLSTLLLCSDMILGDDGVQVLTHHVWTAG